MLFEIIFGLVIVDECRWPNKPDPFTHECVIVSGEPSKQRATRPPGGVTPLPCHPCAPFEPNEPPVVGGPEPVDPPTKPTKPSKPGKPGKGNNGHGNGDEGDCKGRGCSDPTNPGKGKRK